MSEEIELNDYLDEIDRVESVVGDASVSECTYSKGYMPRQAVFCCLDCMPVSSNIQAGFCFACSMTCHKNHKIEEIYTKRYFRCDCGTLPQLLCSLKPDDITERNTGNKYSHNYSARYCECARPYPDPECPELDEVEMLQCCVCEDWYHTTHLGGSLVPEQFEEMVCRGCVGRFPFLAVYALPEVDHVDVLGNEGNDGSSTEIGEETSGNEDGTSESGEKESGTVEEKSGNVIVADGGKGTGYNDTGGLKESVVVTQCDQNSSDKTDAGPSDDKQSDNANANDSQQQYSESGKGESENDSKRSFECSNYKNCETINNPPKRKRSNECKLFGSSETDQPKKALFYDENFRENVCKCIPCIEMYRSNDLNFLTDAEDPLFKYEERARLKRQEEDEQLQNTLENLPHQAKCEVARAIGSLHNTIETLVRKIATEGQASVGSKEIKEAFKTMASETNVDPSIFDHI